MDLLSSPPSRCSYNTIPCIQHNSWRYNFIYTLIKYSAKIWKQAQQCKRAAMESCTPDNVIKYFNMSMNTQTQKVLFLPQRCKIIKTFLLDVYEHTSELWLSLLNGESLNGWGQCDKVLKYLKINTQTLIQDPVLTKLLFWNASPKLGWSHPKLQGQGH